MSSFSFDTVYGIMGPGDLITSLRERHGLSQRELAYRAGTSQSAIARIETGAEDVTWTRLGSILAARGEEPVLDHARLPSRYELADLRRERAMPPEERLAAGLALSQFASEVALAGARARSHAGT